MLYAKNTGSPAAPRLPNSTPRRKSEGEAFRTNCTDEVFPGAKVPTDVLRLELKQRAEKGDQTAKEMLGRLSKTTLACAGGVVTECRSLVKKEKSLAGQAGELGYKSSLVMSLAGWAGVAGGLTGSPTVQALAIGCCCAGGLVGLVGTTAGYANLLYHGHRAARFENLQTQVQSLALKLELKGRGKEPLAGEARKTS